MRPAGARGRRGRSARWRPVVRFLQRAVLFEVAEDGADGVGFFDAGDDPHRAAGKVDTVLMEDARRGMLLQIAQGLQSNADIADYYVARERELRLNGRFDDDVSAIEAVAVEDFAAVAKQYLSPARAAVFEDTATLSWTQFYLLLATVVVLVAVVTLRSVRHRRTARRGT